MEEDVKNTEVNPRYTTIWAVVMPYNDYYADLIGRKAWVRLFSVEETAMKMLEKVKKLAILQGKGEPFVVDAELVDWTLPGEIEIANTFVCIELPISGTIEPIAIIPQLICCEKYKDCGVSIPTVPHIEHDYTTNRLLLKFNTPLPSAIKNMEDMVMVNQEMENHIIAKLCGSFKSMDDIINRSNAAKETADPLIVVDPDGSGSFIFASEQDKNDWIQLDEYGIFRAKEEQ